MLVMMATHGGINVAVSVPKNSRSSTMPKSFVVKTSQIIDVLPVSDRLSQRIVFVLGNVVMDGAASGRSHSSAYRNFGKETRIACCDGSAKAGGSVVQFVAGR